MSKAAFNLHPDPDLKPRDVAELLVRARKTIAGQLEEIERLRSEVNTLKTKVFIPAPTTKGLPMGINK